MLIIYLKINQKRNSTISLLVKKKFKIKPNLIMINCKYFNKNFKSIS